MAYTYSRIASYTASNSSVASVSFLNIPQNYTDLVIKASPRVTSTTPDMFFSFNSSSANLSDVVMFLYTGSTGANTSSTIRTNTVMSLMTSGSFGNTEVYIPNYASSNFKSISADSVSESNEVTNAFIYMTAGGWASTEPINSVTITLASGHNLAQHSSFSIYGIKAEV